MKNIFVIVLLGVFFLLVQFLFVQDVFLDKLVEIVCGCIFKKDIDVMFIDDFQMQFGFCIMEAVGVNQVVFEKEYGEFNLSDQFVMIKLGE